MRKTILIISVLTLVFSCKEEVPETKQTTKKETKENAMKPLGDKAGLDSLIMENGLKIHWLKKGNGPTLKLGDCIDIAYKVFLDNGKLVEGNHKLNKATVPFVVGFGMQTEGWDLALSQLKVGDEVEIFLPSKLARGEKGIEGMIPPNANNILYIKVVKKRKSTREIDGNKVYVFEENKANKVKFNRENTIEFYTMTSSESSPMYFNSFREGRPFAMQMKDAGTVPGLKKALNNAKKADRMFVVVPPSEAYGDKGYLQFVKPNEHLLFNIFVNDVY